MSVVADFATKNFILFSSFLENLCFSPFLTKKGHFSMTKYCTNHYKSSSVLSKYGSINLIDSFLIKHDQILQVKQFLIKIDCIICLYCSLRIGISCDKNDVKI